jgi:DNA polymerase-3 subunit delta
VPLHILYGYETFARGEALSELKAALDNDGSLATNTATFVASQTTPQEVASTCQAVPFLGEHRLVVLEGALGASGGKGRRGSKKAASSAEEAGPWGTLPDTLADMPPTTTLVLVDGEVPESVELLKALRPLAQECRKCVAPKDKELPGWIMSRAKRTGLKIEPAAAGHGRPDWRRIGRTGPEGNARPDAGYGVGEAQGLRKRGRGARERRS